MIPHEEQNAIIEIRLNSLMESVFELIDEMYQKDEETLSKGEKKFFDAFHDYMEALDDSDE